VKESLIKLRFKIDRLSARDRIILLGLVIFFILVIWLFLFYFPQQSSIEKMKLAIVDEQNQTVMLRNRQQIIQNFTKDTTISLLLARFEKLKHELKKFEFEQSQYMHRYIGEQELAKLLYSMLEKTGGVTIENFATIDYTEGQPAETIGPTGIVGGAPPSAAVPAEPPPPPNPAQALPVERVQYRLVLNGDYFSIMKYLRQLEQLKWELYWDKLVYKVKTYPQGRVDIQFYTLKPSSELLPTQMGGTTP
jgi:MSHA biogenesis protein MshJ